MSIINKLTFSSLQFNTMFIPKPWFRIRIYEINNYLVLFNVIYSQGPSFWSCYKLKVVII